MIVREASLSFRVVREGRVEALDGSTKIADYVRDVFSENPTTQRSEDASSRSLLPTNK